MKTISTFFCGVMFSLNVFAQGAFTDTLNINSISAIYSATSFLFANPDTYEAGYVVPGTEPGQEANTTIFVSGFWMGGMDQLGGLHVAAQTYRQLGADFFAGPIATDYASAAYTDRYNRVWVVNKATIDEHIANWNTAGYVVPASIADWPGNGNVANGEAQILAPFFDRDANMMYEPEKGDYPIIRGDEAVFILVNDAAETHTETDGDQLGFELHIMAYAYKTAADPVMDYTTFLNIKLINRSVNTYNNFYFGFFADPDLGDYNDDYVGSDSTLASFFAYNGDGADDGFNGYGSHPPAMGFTFLNHPMHMFKYYQNDFSNVGNPLTAEDHYNYLQGKWIDGSFQTYGGNGYGGAVPENYMFPGHPLDTTAWSMLSEELIPKDMRGIGSIRPISFNSGDTACVDIALTATFGPEVLTYGGITCYIPAFNAVEILKQHIADVRTWYDANVDACAIRYEAGDEVMTVEQELLTGARVFPNPASGSLRVEAIDGKTIATIQLIQVNGQVVQTLQPGSASISIIPVEQLPAGLYQVTILFADGTHAAESIVIQ